MPNQVSFGDINAPHTTVTFSAGGVYVLQLTASDGTLSSSGTVKITVNTAPTVNAPAPTSTSPSR